jgi:hypothetical protein
MEIILVGKRGEARVIGWSNVIGLVLALSVIIGIGMAAGYRLLSGLWELRVAMMGVWSAVIVVGSGTVAGLKAPLSKLRNLP